MPPSQLVGLPHGSVPAVRLDLLLAERAAAADAPPDPVRLMLVAPSRADADEVQPGLRGWGG